MKSALQEGMAQIRSVGWSVRLFIPGRDLRIQSALPLDVLKSRIREDVEPWRGPMRKMGGIRIKPYEGNFKSGGAFRIARTIQYRNIFLPVLYGEFDDISGSALLVRMRVHPATGILCTLWAGSVLVIAGLATYSIFFRQVRPPILMLLVVWSMAAVYVLLANAAFAYEANLSEKWLKNIAGVESGSVTG